MQELKMKKFLEQHFPFWRKKIMKSLQTSWTTGEVGRGVNEVGGGGSGDCSDADDTGEMGVGAGGSSMELNQRQTDDVGLF